MSEEAENIKLKVHPYPDSPISTVVFDMDKNATVADLKKRIIDSCGDSPCFSMGILKFNDKELDNEDKTLAELGIKNNSEIKNENWVVIKTLTGQTIYITCDENTTVREFLKKLEGKNLGFSYIKLLFSSTFLQRSTLDQKLLGCQIGKNSINYGATLHLIMPSEENKNSDTVFDLNNLEESKNSNLAKVSTTLKKANDVFNLESLDNNSRISSDSKKESENSNYPLLRIIVGIADLLLLAAAVATFLLYFLSSLSLSIEIPIVLAALFVVGAILFFGWKNLLPKYSQKRINSGTDLEKSDKYKEDNEKKPELKKEENQKINSKSK